MLGQDRSADVMVAKKEMQRENARRLLKDKRPRYESPEDKVTVPAKYFQDSARPTDYEKMCAEAEANYAAFNPHKR
jgi:hypothetical protein